MFIHRHASLIWSSYYTFISRKSGICTSNEEGGIKYFIFPDLFEKKSPKIKSIEPQFLKQEVFHFINPILIVTVQWFLTEGGKIALRKMFLQWAECISHLQIQCPRGEGQTCLLSKDTWTWRCSDAFSSSCIGSDWDNTAPSRPLLLQNLSRQILPLGWNTPWRYSRK